MKRRQENKTYFGNQINTDMFLVRNSPRLISGEKRWELVSLGKSIISVSFIVSFFFEQITDILIFSNSIKQCVKAFYLQIYFSFRLVRLLLFFY